MSRASSEEGDPPPGQRRQGDTPSHLPVMLDEVVGFLQPAAGGVIVDCTVGPGGHAEALLSRLEPRVRVVGLDRDSEVLAQAEERLRPFADRVVLVHRAYDGLEEVLAEEGLSEVSGILYDLGVSSFQLDSAERGFSYTRDGPLDMRMDISRELTAADVVNEYPEAELARIIREYGEERFHARVARAIVENRPIRRTSELAEVVVSAIPASARRGGRHPARRTFQAIRIEVNDELGTLSRSLPQALAALRAPGGRLVAVTYHSLEDRIVKRFVEEASRGCICPDDLPVCGCGREPLLRRLVPSPLRPSEEEIVRNRRAESALLRAAERTEVRKVAA